MKNQFEQYYDVVYDVQAGVSLSAALKNIIMWSMEDRSPEGIKAKDPHLAGADFSRMDTTLIVAVLRCTYIINNCLPSWADKVDEAEQVFLSRGLVPRHLLRGLKRFSK